MQFSFDIVIIYSGEMQGKSSSKGRGKELHSHIRRTDVE